VSESPAHKAGFVAGDQILSVDQKKVNSWQAFFTQMVMALGDSGSLKVDVRNVDSNQHKTLVLAKDAIKLEKGDENIFDQLGIDRYRPKVEAIISELVPGGAASEQGLAIGDKIVSVNGEAVRDWAHWHDLVRANPDKALEVSVVRQQELTSLILMPRGVVNALTQTLEGHMGVVAYPPSWPPESIFWQRFGPVGAVAPAWSRFVEIMQLNLNLLGKLITGKLSLKLLSGPIGIAKGAKDSYEHGLLTFLEFLALLSMSLGILNFLPIPILDGGHLLYYGIEGLRGRPLSPQVQALGIRVGLFLILSLTLWVCYQDILRWL